MNRTVGIRVRRSVGRGAIFALGVGGALSAAPHQPALVSASVATLPVTSSMVEPDDPLPRQPRAAVMIYVLETPPPEPPAMLPMAAPAPLRVASTRMSSSALSVTAAPVSGAANGFSYGYCTWWVAHKRPIPWRGNAYQWWWNARSFGFAEGATPRAGAIMVLGISGSSPQGHVAFVESVNPDGSFVVSEMNWWGVAGGGWNRVDYRTVTSMRGILGFIY
ncbi:MAG TPA: CHAP domain-containing protein [Candidatus Dormibacteraeota bacterium]|nr:CHAP domain-containing protein [Candidatus Dormibacteraeota bacterium]